MSDIEKMTLVQKLTAIGSTEKALADKRAALLVSVGQVDVLEDDIRMKQARLFELAVSAKAGVDALVENFGRYSPAAPADAPVQDALSPGPESSEDDVAPVQQGNTDPAQFEGGALDVAVEGEPAVAKDGAVPIKPTVTA
jgi:hypothetical protein